VTLCVRSVSKRFAARRVLNNIDLDLDGGQALCLCGANGAGKSTLLRVIAGLLRPDNGSLALDGYDVRKDCERYKRRLGVISHASMIYAELTVRENLAFAAALHGMRKPAARVEELLNDTALAAFRHDRAGILSRGLLQRLAIARALLHRPGLLLADEPFTGLDNEATALLVSLFRRFADDGGAIVIVTHDVRLGLECCQRVAVLDAGRFRLDAMKTDIDCDRFAQDYLSYARNDSWNRSGSH